MAWMSQSEAIRQAHDVLFAGDLRYTFDRMPILISNLPWRKRLNLVHCGVEALLRSNRIRSLPPVVQIEPTNMCNLRCPLCPSGSDQVDRPRGFMAWDTFKRVIDELGGTMVVAVLYGWGEPLLHPEFGRLVEACTRRGIATVSSSNGHCVQTMEEALALVDAGLSCLVLPLDGSTQEIYARYRRSGNVERVKECAQLIEAAKAKRGSTRPYTNVRLIIMRHNQADVENVRSLAMEIGANMFSIKTVGCLAKSGEYLSFEASDEALKRFAHHGNIRPRRNPWTCPFPFRQPTIFWDGATSVCEFDYDTAMSLGNINTMDFREMWNGERALALRRAIRTSDARPTFCRRCPYQDRIQDSCVISHTELRPV